jgi:hypothetical protein
VHKELYRRHGHFDPRAVDPLLIAARSLPQLLEGAAAAPG